jgi:hypothetical protein
MAIGSKNRQIKKDAFLTEFELNKDILALLSSRNEAPGF